MTAARGPHPRTFSLLLVFLFSYSLIASAHAAGLSGRVTDPDGRTVVNAEVLEGRQQIPFQRFPEPQLDRAVIAKPLVDVLTIGPLVSSDSHTPVVEAPPRANACFRTRPLGRHSTDL